MLWMVSHYDSEAGRWVEPRFHQDKDVALADASARLDEHPRRMVKIREVG